MESIALHIQMPRRAMVRAILLLLAGAVIVGAGVFAFMSGWALSDLRLTIALPLGMLGGVILMAVWSVTLAQGHGRIPVLTAIHTDQGLRMSTDLLARRDYLSPGPSFAAEVTYSRDSRLSAHEEKITTQDPFGRKTGYAYWILDANDGVAFRVQWKLTPEDLEPLVDFLRSWGCRVDVDVASFAEDARWLPDHEWESHSDPDL